MTSPEAEKTLAIYEVGAPSRSGRRFGPLGWILGRASRDIFGEGARSMTATDRRLIVDYGPRGEATVHYASGMLVDCYPKRNPNPLRRLAFPAVCALFVAALLREGYPAALLAIVPVLLLVASLLKDALLVCVEVRRLPDLGEDRDFNVRATFAAYGAHRSSLLAFLRRLNDAVADHNASRLGTPAEPREHDGGSHEEPRHEDAFGAGLVPPGRLREEQAEDAGLLLADEEYVWEDEDYDLSEPHDDDPLVELLEGRKVEGEPQDNEAALLDGLELATRLRAFSPEGDDAPSEVVAHLPGIEPDRGELLVGSIPANEGDAGGMPGPPFAFVLDVPGTFPHARYVASYAVNDAKRAAAVLPGAGALSAWLSEAPVRELLRTGSRTTRTIRLFAALRAIHRDVPGGPARAWLRAFPGRGAYLPRLRARWCLQPAGGYAVRMNFYEEIGPEDFYDREGGLRDAYPPSLDWGPSVRAEDGLERSFGYVNGFTGDVVLADYDEAALLAERLEEEFAERGVLSDPVVELTDPFGGPFELRGRRASEEEEGFDSDLEEEGSSHESFAEESGAGEETVSFLPPLSAARAEDDGARADEDGSEDAALVPLVEREWRRRVFTAVLSEDGAYAGTSERFLLGAETFVSTVRRIADIERRISDPLVPEIRKDALRAQLSEIKRRRDWDLSDLLSDPEALILVLAGAERERAILREVARLAVRDAGSRCDSFEMRLRLRELAEERQARDVDRAR